MIKSAQAKKYASIALTPYLSIVFIVGFPKLNFKALSISASIFNTYTMHTMNKSIHLKYYNNKSEGDLKISI